MSDNHIARWVVDALRRCVIPWKTGPLVFYDDHAAAVARLTRERDEARAEVEQTAADLGEIDTATLCPECGVGVRSDEDGCCLGCGAVATGPGARRALLAIMRLTRERDEARAEVFRLRAEGPQDWHHD
jgi:hypothetical protein